MLQAVSGRFACEKDFDYISRFNGLSKKQPFLAFAMTVFMFSFAGLPSGLAGLLGKIYVFYSAVQAGYLGLAIVGVLCSGVSLYYHLRVVVAMYFLPAEEGARTAELSFPLAVVIAASLILVIVLGALPSLPLEYGGMVMAGV